MPILDLSLKRSLYYLFCFKFLRLIIINIIIIIIIYSIYSPMRFPYKSIQTAYYYKENPPSAYLEAKTSQVYRKNALPKANFR
jgi:hypothetical protein